MIPYVQTHSNPRIPKLVISSKTEDLNLHSAGYVVRAKHHGRTGEEMDHCFGRASSNALIIIGKYA